MSEPTDLENPNKGPVVSSSASEPIADVDKKDDDEKEEGEKEKPMVTAGQLFSYADGLDKFLLVFGGVCAFVNGAAMPAFSEVFGQMLNDLNAGGDIKSAIGKTALIMIYVGIVTFVLSTIQVATYMVAAARQMTRIRSAYFASLLRQDIGWHDEHKPGEVGARLAGDTRIIQLGINDKFSGGIMNLGMMLFGFGFGFYRSWRLTLIMLCTVPLIAGVGALMAVIMTNMSEASRKGFANAGEIATEVLENIKTVQVFGTEDKELERFKATLVVAKAAGKKREFSNAAGIGASYGIMFASYSVAFWYASYLVEWGYNDVGEITATFFSVLMGSFAIGLIFPSLSSFSEARAAAYEVFAVINRDPVIDVTKEGIKLDVNFKGDIEFKDVKFSYPTRPDQKLFTNFNCTVPSGTTAAFSGASGCGKSSTIGLLQRFYDPVEGQVLVDGVDLKDLDVTWWREQIGIVSQEPNLFSGTIIENVRLGKADATKDEIIEACKAANIHETILTLPDQYDTSVGAVGSQLSGGQKQRIAIARAIIKKPRILLLDEATSALDRKSEAEVQAALDEITKGTKRTVVVIAHRLTTIRNADAIHYISYDEVKGSRLEESGTFDELMEKGGHFAVMAAKQNVLSPATGTPPPSTALSTRNQSAEKGNAGEAEEEEEVVKISDRAKAETDKKEVPTTRIMAMNKENSGFVVLGLIGSIISGGLYPAYAVVFSKMLEVLALHANDPDTLRDKTPMWASLFIALGAGAFLGWCLQGFYGIAGEELTEKLRTLLFQNILRQDMEFFDTPGREVGALGANLSGDCEAVHQLWGPSLGYKIQMACNLLTGIIIAFFYSWKIALVVMSVIPVMVISGAIQQVFMLMGTSGGDEESMSDDAVAVEAISNVRTVTAFNGRTGQVERYSTLVAEREGPAKRNGVIAGIAFGFSQFTMFAVFALGLWYGGQLMAEGEVTFGDVLIASMSVLMGAMGAGEAGGFAAKTADAEIASKRVFAIIDREPVINVAGQSGHHSFDAEVDVKFDDVKFRYPARPDALVLDHFSGEFKSKDSYGLMGKTGCGKSTIIQLIARFYDPEKGEITINGTSMTSLNLRAWRDQLSIVLQEPALFSGSIRENITYGVSRDVSDEEIQEVAEMAHMHDDITQMPDGYNTDVGYRGRQLSGGQKQRVAIARALLRKPKILLLDEATSALDNATEAKVQQGILKAQKQHNMTTIAVAHRLTTIRDSKKILLMEDGIVLEEGSHDELMALNGEYKARWELYMASSS